MFYSCGKTILSLFTIVALAALGYSQRPDYYNWSVCNEENFSVMNCRNGYATDETIQYTNCTHVSVNGFYLLFESGQYGGDSGLAEFLYQPEFGSYQELNATRGKVTLLKLLGNREDPKTSSLSIALERELITDSISKYFETQGSRDDCSIGFPARSLVIHGNESWELISRDGSSICIQVQNTTSFVPGIVRDVQVLGLDYEPYNICPVIKGCTQSGLENITMIANYETFGVLTR